MDDQVKIDGFRIELAEIEAVFGTHPLVDKAAAIVQDNKLALYIKPSANSKAATANITATATTIAATAIAEHEILTKENIADIRTHAAKSLMYYMMPKYVHTS
jgi:acyl-coenzyme A synthetase/AMP-(fatty) acid ligase